MTDKRFESIIIAIDNQGNRSTIGSTELIINRQQSAWLTSRSKTETYFWDFDDTAEFRQEKAQQLVYLGVHDFESYFAAQPTSLLLHTLAAAELSNTEIVAFVKVNANSFGDHLRWLECEVVSATSTINKVFNVFHLPSEFQYLSVDDIAPMIIDSGLGDFPKLIGEIKFEAINSKLSEDLE